MAGSSPGLGNPDSSGRLLLAIILPSDEDDCSAKDASTKGFIRFECLQPVPSEIGGTLSIPNRAD